MEAIEGLTAYSFETQAVPAHCGASSTMDDTTRVANTASSSSSTTVSAGVVVGAALGGMCLILVGLLVVRQRVAKKRADGDHGSAITKDTKPIDESSALEMTVDANTTHNTTKYLSPKATESSESTILGISSSPDDCSEWGDAHGPSKIEDVESPLAESRCEEEPDAPSDFTFGDESSQSPSSVDPPSVSMAAPHDDVPFQPNVHEEEHLMHDVALMGDDGELREGLAEA